MREGSRERGRERELKRERAQERQLKRDNFREKELKRGRSEEPCPVGACLKLIYLVKYFLFCFLYIIFI